jgi:hypothetical protein
MSEYYRVRISEYENARVAVAQMAMAVEAIKSENTRLRAENERLMICVERLAGARVPSAASDRHE